MGVLTPEAGEVTEDLEAHEFEIPCDFAANDTWADIPHGPARWVLKRKKCKCGYTATRLICTNCKDAVIHTDAGCVCGGCDDFVSPFRLTVESIRAL